PVIGNFTDEEFMGASGSQDNSEYPFQRDEVARVPFSRDRNNLMPSVISPKPIDQEPDTSFVGILITVLTTIILLLVAIILAIIARNKRGHGGNVLDAFQHNFNPNYIWAAFDNKRLNCNGMEVKGLIKNNLTVGRFIDSLHDIYHGEL
ncbi:hypothetical protein DOY81_011738, partial [Sarcophaga bullata]